MNRSSTEIYKVARWSLLAVVVATLLSIVTGLLVFDGNFLQAITSFLTLSSLMFFVPVLLVFAFAKKKEHEENQART